MVIKNAIASFRKGREEKRTQEEKECEALKLFKENFSRVSYNFPPQGKGVGLQEHAEEIRKQRDKVQKSREELFKKLVLCGVDASDFQLLAAEAAESCAVMAKRRGKLFASRGILYLSQLKPPFVQSEKFSMLLHVVGELYAVDGGEDLRIQEMILVIATELLTSKTRT